MNASHRPALSHALDTTAPPIVAIRAATPQPKRLSRKTLMAGALVLSAVACFALVSGFSDTDQRRAARHAPEAPQAAAPPESMRIANGEYRAEDLRPPRSEAGDYFWGANAPAREHQDEALRASDINAPSDAAAAAHSAPAPSPAEREADAARLSALQFSTGGHQARDDGADDYRPPRSAFLIHAGSTISAALVTALNSDQPGRVIAQISENMYDSQTGAHLLIPQGARLLGRYDGSANHGDERLLVVWDRLIMPNGWSLDLEGMPGADAMGAAGLRDRVDAHLDRLAMVSLLSGALSVAANEAEGNERLRFAESVGDAAAQEAARVGARMIDRELNIRPTLRIRAGARVRVLVSEDLVLRPYPP